MEGRLERHKFLFITAGSAAGAFVAAVGVTASLPALGGPGLTSAGLLLWPALIFLALVVGLIVGIWSVGIAHLTVAEGRGRESIGLFVDVDETLTKGIIQRAYAGALGCLNEFNQIEAGWSDGSVNSQEFADRLIRLFANHRFTRRRAEELAPKVELQPWTERLMGLPVSKYLVSSGPNYFVHWFAKRYGIPEGDILCSEYAFSDETGLIESCSPVSETRKAIFVGEKARQHSISIGVGDDPTRDGPFVSICTIPILTRLAPTPAYFISTSHEAIVNLVERLVSVDSSAS